MAPGAFTQSLEPVAQGASPEPYRVGPAAPRPAGAGPDRTVRMVLGAAVAVLGLLLVWYFVRLVAYLVIGLVLAYLMRPIVDRLQGVGLARVPAILATFVLGFGGFGVLLVFIAPFVVSQVSELLQLLTPELIGTIAAEIETRIGRFVPLKPGTVMLWGGRVFDTFVHEERIAAALGSVVYVFADLVYAILVIPFVTFFVLKDRMRLRQSILQLVPNRYFEITLTTVEAVETSIGRYFGGLLLQCSLVGVTASVLLALAGLDHALAIGTVCALANTVPYLGPFVGLVAGTFAGVSQTGDFSLVFGVLVAMGLTRAADDFLFLPLIFSRTAQAHPLVILFVVLIGAKLAGVVGMLVAIPAATVLRVVGRQVLWSLRNYRILKAA